jgi:acyl-CoA dehydrogenase
MAVGVARAALERTRELVKPHVAEPGGGRFTAALDEMEADLEAARLLTLKAAWMADNSKPNALEASMAKAKAGRMVTEVTLRCVQLCGAKGYGEGELLEKWARDAKILDIFEGTQQIQQLIVARRVLGKRSHELK